MESFFASSDPDRIPTLEQLLSTVNSDDFLNQIIKGHSSIEAVLNLAINESLVMPHKVELTRLSFRLKIDLAMGMGLINPETLTSYLEFNKLRNDFAHSPDTDFNHSRAKKLLLSLSAQQKQIIGTELDPTEPHELLANIVVVLYVRLENTVKHLRDLKSYDNAYHELVQDIFAKRGKLSPQQEVERKKISQKISEDVEKRVNQARVARSEKGLL